MNSADLSYVKILLNNIAVWCDEMELKLGLSSEIVTEEWVD